MTKATESGTDETAGRSSEGSRAKLAVQPSLETSEVRVVEEIEPGSSSNHYLGAEDEDADERFLRAVKRVFAEDQS